MIEQFIIDRILRGEKVRISVSGRDREIAELRSWLQGFRYSCGGRQFINCNSIRLQKDDSESLDVNIGTIPHGQRELLAGTLLGYRAADSPLTIEEWHKQNTHH